MANFIILSLNFGVELFTMSFDPDKYSEYLSGEENSSEKSEISRKTLFSTIFSALYRTSFAFFVSRTINIKFTSFSLRSYNSFKHIAITRLTVPSPKNIILLFIIKL